TSSPGRRPRRPGRIRASGSSAPAAPAGGTRPAPRTPLHPLHAPVTEDRLSPSCAPSFRTTSCLRPVYTPPTARTGRPAGAQFPSAAVYALPTTRTIRPPDRAAAAGHDPGRLTMESSAANRRKQPGRTLARVFGGWRTGLSGPVIV